MVPQVLKVPWYPKYLWSPWHPKYYGFHDTPSTKDPVAPQVLWPPWHPKYQGSRDTPSTMASMAPQVPRIPWHPKYYGLHGTPRIRFSPLKLRSLMMGNKGPKTSSRICVILFSSSSRDSSVASEDGGDLKVESLKWSP